jgi:hypothetical protein
LGTWLQVSGPVIIKEYTNDTGTTYAAGELVKLSSGVLTIASAGAIWGVALKAAVASATIPVQLIFPGQLWEQVYSTTTSATLVGVCKDITFTTTAQNVTTTTSSPDFVIVEVSPKDAVGTSGGRLIGSFSTTACQTVNYAT